MRIQALSDEPPTAATTPVRTAPSPKGPGRPESRIGDGSGGGSAKMHANRGRPPEAVSSAQTADVDESGPSASAESSQSSGSDARDFDADACVEALLVWLNNAGNQGLDHPMTEEATELLVSTVAEGVSVTICSSGELSAMRTPWGDRACRAEAVAAWCADDHTSSWKLDNWRADLQRLDGRQENLLICSVAVPSGDRWRRHLSERRVADSADASQANIRNTTYILVCRFDLVHQALENKDESSTGQGQYCVISCPPNVLPMRFATSGQPRWRLEHKQVLPLPD